MSAGHLTLWIFGLAVVDTFFVFCVAGLISAADGRVEGDRDDLIGAGLFVLATNAFIGLCALMIWMFA